MWSTAVKNIHLIGRKGLLPQLSVCCKKSTAVSPDIEFEHAKPFKEIPGPGGVYSIPNIGVAFFLKPIGDYTPETLHKCFDKLHDKYGEIFQFGLLGRAVMTADPATFVSLLKNEGKYPERGTQGGLLDVYGKKNNKEKGMGVLNGIEWKNLRSAAQKYTSKVNSATIYVGAQSGVASDFVTRLSAREFTPEEFREELFKYATESIGIVCFNNRLGCMDPDFRPVSPDLTAFLTSVKRFFELFQSDVGIQLYRIYPTKLYRQFEKVANITYSYGRDQIKANLARIEQQVQQGTFDPDEPNLILQLKSNPNLSLEAVNATLLDLLAAGADSTAKGVESFLLNLALNPDKQQKLYEEILEVVGPKGSELEAKHVSMMPYYRACMKESFRLRFPTGAGTARVLPHDAVIGGYHIPKGTFILLNSRRACLNEKYFQSASQYVPERWLRDEQMRREDDIPSIALVPFGIGLRNCIGRRFAEQELWLGITKIVQNFNVTITDQDRDYSMIYKTFGETKDPPAFKFTPR